MRCGLGQELRLWLGSGKEAVQERDGARVVGRERRVGGWLPHG